MLLGRLEARLPWWDLTMSNSFLLLGKDGGCECPLKRTGKPLSSYNPGTFSLIWLGSGENTGGGHPGWEGALAGQRCLGKTVSARVASNMAGGLAGKCLRPSRWAGCQLSAAGQEMTQIGGGWGAGQLWALDLLGYGYHLFHPKKHPADKGCDYPWFWQMKERLEGLLRVMCS